MDAVEPRGPVRPAAVPGERLRAPSGDSVSGVGLSVGVSSSDSTSLSSDQPGSSFSPR